jgi:hypothetical protein
MTAGRRKDKERTNSGVAVSAKSPRYLSLVVIRVNPRDPRLKLSWCLRFRDLQIMS